MSKKSLGTALTLMLVLGGTGTAHAAGLIYDQGNNILQLTSTAAGGEQLTGTYTSGDTLDFRAETPITFPAGRCVVQEASTHVVCTDSSPKALILFLVGAGGPDVLKAVLGTGNPVGQIVLNGMAGADTLTGTAVRDVLNGSTGDDTITGFAGNDGLIGAGGTDTVRYDDGVHDAGVAVNLATERGGRTGVDGFGDEVIGFENVVGSAGDDTITGTIAADVLDGGGGTDLVSYADRTTPVAVDLQSGANPDGDTLSGFEGARGGSAGDSLAGDGGPNVLVGGPGTDVLNGRPGTDLASYEERSTPVVYDALAGLTPDDDAFTSIEGVRGGSGGDTLTGFTGAEVLEGLAGADTIDGGPGADVLRGGDGQDVLSFASRATTVTASLGSGTTSDGDTLSGFEDLRGGSGGDTLTGDGTNNVLVGGAGADALQGGAGVDLVSYQERTTPLTIDLAAGLPDGDTASGFEVVRAGSGPDVFRGTAGADVMDGWLGDDELDGRGGGDELVGGGGDDELDGRGGDDDLEGGDGTDRVSYASRSTGVTARTDGTIVDGGETDRIFGIETILGGAGADTLAASGVVERLQGGPGDDRLRSLGGRRLTLEGGAGRDVADYLGFGGPGAISIRLDGSAGGYDVFAGVEDVEADAGPQFVSGTDGPNRIATGEGDDEIDGGDGADVVDAGADNDVLLCRSATASCDAGTGDDLIDLPQNAAPAALDAGDGADVLRLSGPEGATFALQTAWQVETLEGTPGSDVLTGTPAAERLDGGGDADVLTGGGGADELDGGDDTDTAAYGDRSDGVTVALGAAGNEDALTSIEGLTGGPGDDTLTGDSGANRLSGAGGRDDLTGAGGDDVLAPGEGAVGALAGGNGADTVSFAGRTTPVTFGLTTAMSAQSLIGGEGDDVLKGTTAAEAIDGGAGRDTVSYADSRRTGVVAELGTNDEGEDALTRVEDLVGGPGADTLTGDAGPNTLDGGPGRDVITALAGADTVRAQDGAVDTIDCGAGSDDALATDLADARTDCEQVPEAPKPPPTVPTTTETTTPTSPTPTTPTTPTTPVTPVTPVATLLRQRTTLSSKLVLRKLPKAARVRVTCTGGRTRGCPKARKLRARRATLALGRYVRPGTLRPGAVLRITVTATGFRGRRFTVTIRRARALRRTTTDLRR